MTELILTQFGSTKEVLNVSTFGVEEFTRQLIGESKTTKIEDADMIGYTKARSEGFTAKKNDKLVATPPRKMKNNGYYN